jgi:hypothetical protein
MKEYDLTFYKSSLSEKRAWSLTVAYRSGGMADLARELAAFSAEVDQSESVLVKAQQESADSLDRTFRQFSDFSKAELTQLHSDLVRLASRVGELCSVLEGEPLSPLEEAIRHCRIADDLLPFLASNEVDQFFLPEKQQRAVVLLDLLELLGALLSQEIVLPWFERALLDFDTHDAGVQARAPAVFAELLEKTQSVTGRTGHLLRHLIRSLTGEYKR